MNKKEQLECLFLGHKIETSYYSPRPDIFPYLGICVRCGSFCFCYYRTRIASAATILGDKVLKHE